MPLSPLISRHILPLALKLLYASLRISITPPISAMPLQGKGTIFAFWHGKMVVGWLLAHKLFPAKKITAVVSMSEDGRILADALEQCGLALIRGSSSKGGEMVKQAMQDVLEQQGIIALTPDGPRGPIYQFKYGTLRLASAKRYPIIFAEINYAKTWQLRSWDRFDIPKPFSKATVTLHRIELPVFRTDDELHQYTTTISERFSHA